MKFKRLTDEERRQIPKGFHFLLEYKEELDWLLDAQCLSDEKQATIQCLEGIEQVIRDLNAEMSSWVYAPDEKHNDDKLTGWLDHELKVIQSLRGKLEELKK